MTTERCTPLPRDPVSPGRRPFLPAAFLAGKDQLARLALLVAALSLVMGVLGLMAGLTSHHQEPLFVVLDPNGNVILVPGTTFMEARELHVQQAMLAASALLLRNAKDFDQPEILQAVCSPTALAQARTLKSDEAKEFESRQMQQKPLITRIEAITTRREEVQIQVSGKLVRWGVVQEAPFDDAVPFTLRLVLKLNPDLVRNRRQPLIVTQFTLRYEKPST